MTVNFHTLGCKVNQYETQVMREYFLNYGFDTAYSEEPDIFVINSCTVTSQSDRKTRQMVRKYRNKYPSAVIVLTGCVPQAFPDMVEELVEADVITGNANNSQIVELVNRFIATKSRVIELKEHEKNKVTQAVQSFQDRTKAYVKIEDGCNRFCSYCIIPYARGRVRSKTIEDIKSEVTTLANNGFKEVVLIGINLSAYGLDSELNLADAVETAASVQGIERVRLGSMEPDQFSDEMIDRLSKISKLCPQFHLSLQSGCDTTLKSMNRHYDTTEYFDLISKLRSKFPNCAITTDIMVGFPGETPELFNESLQFLVKCEFASAHVFAYSRRKGTPADKMPEQISNAIKQERSAKLIEASTQSTNKFHEKQIGKINEVLFETKINDNTYEGYTKNYVLVQVNSSNNLCGKIENVKIISHSNQICFGELV